MSCKDNSLIERLLKCEEELEYHKADLETWTDALEELSEIEDAFKTNEKFDMCGKTILDVGTDAVKPLYIALKFKPSKIIGINEELRPFVSDLELQSKILTATKVRLYNCSFFDKVTLDRIREKERIKDKKFDFVLVSKTLHHLRTGDCIAKKRDKSHKHNENEKCCIYKFETQKTFKDLLQLGNRVIIYEFFDPNTDDDDKMRGRGGYFTAKEWTDIFDHLFKKYRVKFIRPQHNKETLSKVKPMLRQVDCICFYVEEQV